MHLTSEIRDRAAYWATSQHFDTTTRDEVARLLEQNHAKELADRFYRDLEFGTGGMRGVMSAGTARMNIHNIRKATRALGLYLKEVFSSEPHLKVGIAYDSRRNSRKFAEATAEVLSAMGIRTLITRELRPVPLLSFLVRHYGCHAGVCITASHNPPEYNGFKVYWQTGGQLVPPHDEGIIRIYEQIQDYGSLARVPFAEAKSEGLVEEIDSELDEAYLKELSTLEFYPKIKKDLKIVYSPLHGSGITILPEALKRFGFRHITVVPEQKHPDGNFPTVKAPNPEDDSALEMALQLAKRQNADLVAATDPDADRIGVIVREGDSWIRFNGNQLACLLTEFMLSSLKQSGRLPPNPCVIKTVVTTDLMARIAKFYGATCEETLTGFKWIGDRIEAHEQNRSRGLEAPQYVCGGEESYGFLAGTFVRDKDGVMGCVLAAEMMAYYRSEGKTLTQVLHQIYERHGVYGEALHTVTLPGQEGAQQIAQMMQAFRQSPPTEISGIPVQEVLDYKDGMPARGLPPSDVLQFRLMDHTLVTLRPSGTEPKLKLYLSACEAVGSGVEAGQARIAERLQGLYAALRQRLTP